MASSWLRGRGHRKTHLPQNTYHHPLWKNKEGVATTRSYYCTPKTTKTKLNSCLWKPFRWINMKPEDIYIWKKNIFNQDLTNILCKKKRKSCDKQTKEWWSLFTQIQISIISNLCCEKTSFNTCWISYIDFFSKCYCTLICFIGLLLSVITITSSSLLICWSYHHSYYHGYSGFFFLLLLLLRLKKVFFSIIIMFFSFIVWSWMHCHTTCSGVRLRLNVLDISLCWTPMETERLGWDVTYSGVYCKCN